MVFIAEAMIFIAEAMIIIAQYSFATSFSLVFFVPFFDLVSLVSFDLTVILSFVLIEFFVVHFLIWFLIRRSQFLFFLSYSSPFPLS